VDSRSKAHGWIEQIRIHDILHYWCEEEARYAGLVDVMDKTVVGQVSTPHFVKTVFRFVSSLFVTFGPYLLQKLQVMLANLHPIPWHPTVRLFNTFVMVACWHQNVTSVLCLGLNFET
jgi:hypothetical protein